MRFSARLLWRDRGITIAAVLMLAAAIALNATIFVVVRAVMVRGFPQVADNSRLVYIQESRDGQRMGGVFPADLTTWRDEVKTLADLAVITGQGVTLNELTEPNSRDPISSHRVSWNLFRLLGVAPVLGRDFRAGDDVPGAEPVAILSHDLWTRRFGRDPAVVGRVVRIDREPATIIGVLPEGFTFPYDLNLWMPLARPAHDTDHSTVLHMAIGRLAAGATIEQARTEFDLIAARLSKDHPDTNRGIQPHLESFTEMFIGPDSTVIYTSMSVAVLFVLLIACANLANLTLTRTIGRSRELALRLALGAGRWRIIRQLFAESLIVSAISGAIAWLVTVQAVRIYADATHASHQVLDYSIDATVGAYVAALSLGTALLLALISASRISRVDGNATLKDGARGIAGTVSGQRTSTVLVAVQMTLAVILLCGAGLMARSFLKFQTADIGVKSHDVLVGALSLVAAGYTTDKARVAFVDRLTARLDALPTVAAQSIASFPPAWGAERLPFALGDRVTSHPVERQPAAATLTIGSNYFSTLGTPVLAGREFTRADTAESAPVAIVNERFAAQFWPSGDPLQQRIRLGDAKDKPSWLTIVGVVANVQQVDVMRQKVSPLVYVPFRQRPVPRIWFFARTRVPAAAAASAVRQEVASLDPELIVREFSTLDDRLAFSQERTDISHRDTQKNAVLFPIFAAVALLIAVIGLYATVAYAVSRRTQEIGIRMALGAETRAVHALVIRQALPAVAAGLAIGIGVSLAGARVLESQMVGISPFDPVSFGMTAVILIATAASGCVLPARRAARVDPAITLRHE